LPTTTLTLPDGTVISYLTRRFVPPPERFAMLKQHVVRRATGSTTWPPNTSTTRCSGGAWPMPTARCGRRPDRHHRPPVAHHAARRRTLGTGKI